MFAALSRRDFLQFSALAIATGGRLAPAVDKISGVPANLDHILLGVSDLDRGIAWVEGRSGVRAMPGGAHPGRGTRNALLALGPERYLEIISPDPAQAGISNAMVDGLRSLEEPRLIGWAVHTDDLASMQQTAAAAGLETENLRDGSRARPDGKLLRWISCNLKNDFNGALPFFIQWSADSIHPSQDAPIGCRLENFWIESPNAGDVSQAAQKLGFSVEVRTGSRLVLHARIQGKKKTFELS